MPENKTLSRIAALLRKAEATDNEHEADAYMQAAQRIATATSIDLAVARAMTAKAERRKTPTTERIVIGPPRKRGLGTYVGLFLAIGSANDVKCDIAMNSTSVFAFGFDTDIETTKALYSAIIVQMVRAADRYIKTRQFETDAAAADRQPVSAISARIAFQNAYASRIGQRLREAREEAIAETPVDANPASPGAEIALRAKDIELADFYRATSRATRTWKGSSVHYAPSAARAGSSAADRARLGTERALGGERVALGA